MITVFGLPNCNTVKKTTDWLTAHKISFQFHNFKTDGIDPVTLKKWFEQKNWELFLNKKSTTWRGLDAATQASLTTKKAAYTIIQQHTSIIKRPVIEKAGKVVAIGFDEAAYIKIFKTGKG